MGVYIKDTAILYGNANVGAIDVSHGEFPPPTWTLPSGMWAQYEGNTAAVTASATTWADSRPLGENETPRHITLTDVRATDWVTDHLNLPAGSDRFGNGTIYDNASAATPVQTTFSVDNGYTFNALVKYKADGTKHGQTGVDVLFSPSAGSSNNRTQLHIGERGSASADKIRIGTNTGGWEIFETDAQSNLGTGIHLLTWAVSAMGNEVNIYMDGKLIGTFEPTRTLTGTSGLKLYFFAANLITSVNSNRYNFAGDVYAMSIYQRALTADEVAQAYLYYKQQYKDY